MISKRKSKNYFTFFGVLVATINYKMSSLYSTIANIMTICVPKITNLLASGELKPIKAYSTNNIKN